MSLKRRAKLEYKSSPKSSVHKKTNEDLKLASQMEVNKQNYSEHYLLHKMQQKIAKILKAYQNLQDESKRKDDVIKQLEKQNMLLKKRLLQKTNQLKQSRLSETTTKFKKQSSETHVVQRTFTPFNAKRQNNATNQYYLPKQKNFNNPSLVLVKQNNSKNQYNKLLKESESLQYLNKTAIPYKSKSQTTDMPTYQRKQQIKEEDNKIFSNKDQNRGVYESLGEERSFVNVLGKLKQKIRKVDEEEDAQTKKTVPKQKEEQKPQQNMGLGLSKVKSSHQINCPFSFNDKQEKQQSQALRKIWNERDKQIKRMEALFSKIDQRISVIEKE